MKPLFFFIAIFLMTAVSIAQTNTYNGFVMAESPVIHTLGKEVASESAVYIKDARKLELISSKEGVSFYSSYHRIVRLNDEKGVENFNKIYIQVSEYMELKEIKARAITPGNKIIEVKQDAIKDFTDEEGNSFKIFAVDGLSNGSEIEYIYTVKRAPFFFGKEVFQYKFPVQDASMEIITPATIKFEAKAFNGGTQPEEVVDEEKNQRMIRYSSVNIPSYSDEKYAMIRPGLQQLQYKLSYTQSKGMNVRMFTWNELAKDVYSVYNEFTKKEKEVAEDMLKKTDIKATDSDEQKIRKIESYIKTTVKTGDDVSGEDFNDFGKIQKNKIATTKAMNRLVCAVLQKAGVNFEVVVAANREEYLIERSFENWNNAQNLLLYFPSLKKFIAPSSFLYRYPFIPPLWGGTLGLYCVPVEVGEMKSAFAEIKGIPLEASDQTRNDLESVLIFNKTMDTVFVNTKHIQSGYSAPLYKAQFIFLSADDQKVFLKEMARNSGKTETILGKEIQNKELDITEVGKPFIVDLKLASVDLFENAGEKILLKVGECIGPQVEMYNERQRQFDIEIDYPHHLDRKITLEIPEGYRVKNADDLNFNLSYSTNNKVTMAFISSYRLNGNRLEITISEQYNLVRWPKSEYDNFVKVINASADFNKVILVLEKK